MKCSEQRWQLKFLIRFYPVTMFYAVNGKPPYNSDTDSQFDIFTKIVYEPLPEFSVKSKFNDTVIKACQKNREQRFQSCSEWINLLTTKSARTKNSSKDVTDNHSNEKTFIEQPYTNNTKIESETTNPGKNADLTISNVKETSENKKFKYGYVLGFISLIVLAILIVKLKNNENSNLYDPLLTEIYAIQDSAVVIGISVDRMLNAKHAADTSDANFAMVDSLRQSYENWKMAMPSIDSSTYADPGALKANQQAWLDAIIAFRYSLQ